MKRKPTYRSHSIMCPMLVYVPRYLYGLVDRPRQNQKTAGLPRTCIITFNLCVYLPLIHEIVLRIST